MYKPAPQRPKKTSIVRSRSGCKACRQRRVKCDEKKPSCSACVRHGKKCEAVSSTYDFRTSVVLANTSHGVRYPKRSRVVYRKETTVDTTVGCDDVSNSALDTVSDEANHTNDAFALAPGLISEEWSVDDPTSYQYQSPESPALLPLPSPSQRRSLGRSENELFYLTYWETSCAQSLPRFLGHIVEIAYDNAPLMQALLALSACNMSRALPESECETSSSQVTLTYRPRREHLLSSQRYYGSAVQQIARSINRNSLSSLSHTLAVLVLFCYFESAMGNFAGFGCHAQGVDTFIQTHFAAIASDQLGRELTAAWILAKNHNWWLRMHFSSVSLQLRQPSLALPPEISHILLAINARRAVVTSILCESYRLNNVALLQLWPCGHRHPDLKVDQCIASLEIESKKLDEWHSALPRCELPIESFPSFDARDRDSGNFHPLLFTSHTLAMNYAYYACSRLLQCTTLFHDLRQPQNPSATAAETETETNHWIRIILRIVAGLDKQTCFRENVYSIGISSLLAACLLRCHDSTIGTWIETWLSDWRSNNSALEEGSFPIAQVWELTRLINEEKAAGNDIHAIALPEDDGGGKGKYTSYYSQHLDRLVLLGRRGCSGRLYSELVPVRIEGSVS